jgi:hypothetical protein
MKKARNHYKNPNKIHQLINLPIYKLTGTTFLVERNNFH